MGEESVCAIWLRSLTKAFVSWALPEGFDVSKLYLSASFGFITSIRGIFWYMKAASFVWLGGRLGDELL